MSTRETFELTIDDYVAALLVAGDERTAELEGRRDASPLGRADRVMGSAERWCLRLLILAMPLLGAGALLLRPGTRGLGILLLVAVPFVFLLWIRLERFAGRFLARAGGRVDAASDGVIARAAARALRAAVERKGLPILLGSVTAELDGDRLDAEAGDHRVTIASVAHAWRARTATHLALAPGPPKQRTDVSQIVLLPADGPVAAALAGIAGIDD